MNRSLLGECFRVAGRTTWYLEPAEIQRDPGRFLAYYNLERSHQGNRLKGRTPTQALREALGIEGLPPFTAGEEETEEPAALGPLHMSQIRTRNHLTAQSAGS